MKDPKKRIAQNKLIILYLLNAIEIRLSQLQILKIVTEKGWINYFDLKECLFELSEGGMIESHETQNGKFYSISELGKTTLYFFKKELLSSLRQEIDTYCKKNRVDLQLETELLADYLRIAEGEYRVTLKVIEKTKYAF